MIKFDILKKECGGQPCSFLFVAVLENLFTYVCIVFVFFYFCQSNKVYD